MREFAVSGDEAGVRADVFVAGQYPEFTRSSLERLFDDGLVKINQKPAKASRKIRSEDVVVVDETLLRANPEPIDMPILYEDKDVIVISKPAGVLTHSKGALNTEPTVASFIKDKITDPLLSGNRAGIAHRLDRQTSGVIITAKNLTAQRWLQKQFSSRRVKKKYRAIIEGELELKKAVIEAPIGRNPRAPQTFIVNSAGKPAVTEYHVVRVIQRKDALFSEVELHPLTGRTHQLRIHMAYIGHAIVGDVVYGHSDSPMLLHAESLEITLPDKHRRTFTAETPPVFKEFLHDV